MKTKKIITLLLLLFIVRLSIASAGNYKQGYVITNQQDTISGWINFKTDKMNQEQCEFKQDLNHAARIYFPGDIEGYRFTDDGKYYVSKEIPLNGTSRQVFLEFLVKGMMNLYYYDDTIIYYFFENQDGKMEIVSRKPEEITGRAGDLYSRTDNSYIGKIRYLFRDYQPIAQRADNLKFNQKTMMGIVEEYHNEVCTTGESCIIFQNEHPDKASVIYKFSVYGGLQLSNYTFGKSSNINVETVSNLSPVLGVQVNLLNPRWSKSFSVQLDASLSQFKGEKPPFPELYRPAAGLTSYNSLASSLRLGVKYTYPKYKIAPTVEAGIAYTYLFYSSGENKYAPMLKRRHLGYYLAVGADYKLRTSNAVFIRLVYEDSPMRGDKTQRNGIDKISLPHVKIGYTF